MVVPPKHPKMIIFSRKTPWLLGTSILGNLHIATLHSKIIEMMNRSISNSSYLSTTTPFSIKTMIMGSKYHSGTFAEEDFP